MENNVSVKMLAKALDLSIVYGEEYSDNIITREVVSRPGVEIYSGYFDLYEHTRIQVLGTKELNLFNMIDSNIRKERVEKLFSFLPPAFVFTHNVGDIPSEFFEAAKKYHIPMLRSYQSTTITVSALGTYLSEELAVKKSFHGVMLDINGVGVMITGKSKIGKSEAALQLLMKGHTLVCDDRVDISEPSVGNLVTYCPKSIERLMEVRGLGIVDVVDLFGVKAFRNRKRLMLIVELKSPDDEEKNVNRLGLDEDYETIFNTKVPKVTIYVRTGRNIASLIEVAAMNWRLKSYGKNAALEFSERLSDAINNRE